MKRNVKRGGEKGNEAAIENNCFSAFLLFHFDSREIRDGLFR
ncbi:hypothetical protein [Burkholderia sp. WAC0059]|nr:hypothetical protein [Burkholderia sp. WAC0059]